MIIPLEWGNSSINPLEIWSIPYGNQTWQLDILELHGAFLMGTSKWDILQTAMFEDARAVARGAGRSLGTLEHPLKITIFDRCYVNHSQSWVVHYVVSTTCLVFGNGMNSMDNSEKNMMDSWALMVLKHLDSLFFLFNLSFRPCYPPGCDMVNPILKNVPKTLQDLPYHLVFQWSFLFFPRASYLLFSSSQSGGHIPTNIQCSGSTYKPAIEGTEYGENYTGMEYKNPSKYIDIYHKHHRRILDLYLCLLVYKPKYRYMTYPW